MVITFITFSRAIRIIRELGGDSPSTQSTSVSSEANLDILYKLQFIVPIVPIVAFVMGIYFIVYIARTKRFHIITSVAWMILLIIPYLNILTVPAFWIFLVLKEIKGAFNNAASGNNGVSAAPEP